MTTRQSSCVRNAFHLCAFLLALVFAPVLAWAAPFAAYVIDARTGEVLYETNSDTRLHPASLTKMMTLYIAFQAIERGEISLDTKVTVSKHAASQAPSKLGLKPGQKIALRYLIRAAAIKSANDAATAIGEAIEGSESAFAKRMTRTAKSIGMTRSTFRNANGLTAEGHLSTAHDMTLLGRHLFYDFPQYYNIFSRRTADAGVAQVASTNRRFLDSYEGADGIKTGYTGPAGFNLTASAQRGNKRIIATVLGGKSTAWRNAKMTELLDIGFGKAPNKATVQKPEAPMYLADADDTSDDADVLAAAVANDVEIIEGGTEANHAAGKTIRLQLAVTKSRRPLARPTAKPADDPTVAVAVADAAITAPVASVTDESSADLPDETTLAALSDGIDAALAEVQKDNGPVFEQSTEPQPETLALAEFAEVTPPAETGQTETIAAAVVAEAQEASADIALVDDGVADAPLQIALADPASPPTTTGTDPTEAVVVSDATAVGLVPAPLPRPAVIADAASEQPADNDTILVAASVALPGPKADQIVLADMSGDDVVTEDLVVVTRASTSGGRQWAINVGKFNSRYDAERELLQTALTEINVLGESLRKVVNRKGGFDANFVGMTQETAELACRRLTARSGECTVIGPQG